MSHTTYPSQNSIYGSQQGLFVPHIHEIRNARDSSDVLYNRFCKAICFLYVPHKKTCGTNNKIYINACQAKCDRTGVDDSRLMFNESCCCNGGSHKIDASFAAKATNGVSALGAVGTCVHVASKDDTGTVDNNNLINVFAVPKCIAQCLGIDSKADLEFIDQTRTYLDGCADNM
jgi:hypothetical protein